MISIISFILGPVETNSYLIADEESKEAVVIDPAWDGAKIVAEAVTRNWNISNIWITHAHFDHLGGTGEVVDLLDTRPSVALHPEDLAMWHAQGGAQLFGIRIGHVPEPSQDLSHGQQLLLGSTQFEVRHAPGHSKGHVMFYCQSAKVLFCGDVIFRGGIGRTDLPGGDYNTLIESIYSQVLTLPDETRLMSGHGPETTVGVERIHNPFLG
ncbi:MAG: MBL fold metallo-hydrolase [Anaerolineales bacterium]|nr:MBL fold metallo-hydrolase [Anaerolineales bacterium]